MLWYFEVVQLSEEIYNNKVDFKCSCCETGEAMLCKFCYHVILVYMTLYLLSITRKSDSLLFIFLITCCLFLTYFTTFKWFWERVKNNWEKESVHLLNFVLVLERFVLTNPLDWCRVGQGSPVCTILPIQFLFLLLPHQSSNDCVYVTVTVIQLKNNSSNNSFPSLSCI